MSEAISVHKMFSSGLSLKFSCTLRSQIEGYTRLLILRKFSTLPAVIWASPFINIQENFQLFCFFTYTNENFSTLPAVIRASPLIKFRKEFQSTLLLEPPLVLETQEYVVTVKSKVKILQNFVAFSEYMNFTLVSLVKIWIELHDDVGPIVSRCCWCQLP